LKKQRFEKMALMLISYSILHTSYFKMQKTLLFGTFVAISLFLSACGDSQPTPTPTPTPAADTTAKVKEPADKEAILSSSNGVAICAADSLNVGLDSSKAAAITSASIAESNNLLGLNMYKVMAKSPDELKGNTFLSPYSVSMAFAMLYLGSAGESTTEIGKVMGWKQNSEALHRALNQVSTTLRAAASDSTYTLGIANRIWANKTDFCVRPAYQQQASEFYRAAPLSLDFSAIDAAIKTINDWASDNTNGKISELYAAKSLDPATQMVLANAVYFKADWLDAFDKKATQPNDFFADDQPTKADFMNAFLSKNEGLKYFQEPTFSALVLPYKGNQLSLYVLLPKEKTDVNKLIASLNTKTIQKLVGTAGVDFDKINIALPKWTTKYSVEMTAKLLPALGMRNLFTNCNLSRMTSVGGLQISSVLHKTFIAVDEKGTEAAAVTSIAITKSAPDMDQKIVNFYANRPFLYFIADNKTGTILFIGNIAKP
jgi:serpin B